MRPTPLAFEVLGREYEYEYKDASGGKKTGKGILKELDQNGFVVFEDDHRRLVLIPKGDLGPMIETEQSRDQHE